MDKTTKQLYGSNSFSRKRDWISLFILIALFGLTFAASAQEGSQGNTTIFGGGQMTFFGNHNFIAPAGGTQPGVILTERATGNISYLNFFGNGLTSTVADASNYVDGYVRKYGTGQFIFPVGDSNAGTGYVGQFAASADGTSGAYFHANPSTAITSNLFTGNDYPVLPAGGPFATTSKATNVNIVSTVEYWDIDGATATPITLTWNAASAIGTLTSNTLTHLTIVGWNGTQWVKIPSTIDATSILGGASALTAGSITTTASITPDTYTAYTFASVPVDLTPTITLPNNNFSANGVTKNFVVNLVELLSVVTGENIQFAVTVPTGYSIAFNASQTTITPTGSAVPITLNNAQWNLIGTSLAGRRLTFQAKPGITIAALGRAVLGFTITRVSAQPSSSPVITANIVNDATHNVYDTVDGNNIYSRVINAL